MLCYTGTRNSRIYMNTKSKRTAWRAYMKVNDWWYDLSGLRYVYRELFTHWDNEHYWCEEDSFFDDNQ